MIPEWDEDQISLGRPAAMDIPTLIEYIERVFEGPEKTAARHEQYRLDHEEWHRNNPGIHACCIRSINHTRDGSISVNEYRANYLKIAAKEAVAKGYLPSSHQFLY